MTYQECAWCKYRYHLVCFPKHSPICSECHAKFPPQTVSNVIVPPKEKRPPQVRHRNRVRAYLRALLRTGRAPQWFLQVLGCSVEELRTYLEAKFQPGMTWENADRWHCDHIKPLALFDLTKDEELAIACHFSNIQPLWPDDNRVKGPSFSFRMR